MQGLTSDKFQQIIGLTRKAQDGRRETLFQLTRQINQTPDFNYTIAKIKRFFHKEQLAREKGAERRRIAREKSDRPTFQRTHPVFSTGRRRKKKGSSDAMHRAILCGGFETNRRRH